MINILIVEDDENICQTVSEYVNNAGYSALSVGEGDKAIEIFYENKIDLVHSVPFHQSVYLEAKARGEGPQSQKE